MMIGVGYYASKDVVKFCIEKLGFELVGYEEDRDILFVAKEDKWN
jgi:hypothetical protein